MLKYHILMDHGLMEIYSTGKNREMGTISQGSNNTLENTMKT